MAYNKVIYDGQTLIDLTQDDVTASDVRSGVYFHSADGTRSMGSLNLIDTLYPIGSYYETSDISFNPNIAWGGTWVLETEGQVHVSAGENYEVGDTGGSKDAVIVSHTHLLSSGWQSASGQPDRITYGAVNGAYNNAGYGNVQFIQSTGESGTDKNMPPYIVVNRWHRTA